MMTLQRELTGAPDAGARPSASRDLTGGSASPAARDMTASRDLTGGGGLTVLTPEPVAPTVLVSITPRAAEKAREMMVQKEVPDGALRVFVVGGGCSGYQYGMSLAKETESDDTVIEADGVRIVVDPDSRQLLGGAEIDYVEDLMKSGFTIYNPNAVSSCACGSSFQAADDPGTPRACT
jgi:iron-sulfur cluster assembly protein